MALILIADDEEDVLSVYKTKLERSGFEVITAANGAEAVAAVTAKHPDLILMDMKMPVMDGIVAQQKLMENPATKDVKVVFLTAFSDPLKLDVDEKVAKESGAVDFIKKGINLDELVAKIKVYLEKK